MCGGGKWVGGWEGDGNEITSLFPTATAPYIASVLHVTSVGIKKSGSGGTLGFNVQFPRLCVTKAVCIKK